MLCLPPLATTNLTKRLSWTMVCLSHPMTAWYLVISATASPGQTSSWPMMQLTLCPPNQGPQTFWIFYKKQVPSFWTPGWMKLTCLMIWSIFPTCPPTKCIPFCHSWYLCHQQQDHCWQPEPELHDKGQMSISKKFHNNQNYFAQKAILFLQKSILT